MTIPFPCSSPGTAALLACEQLVISDAPREQLYAPTPTATISTPVSPTTTPSTTTISTPASATTTQTAHGGGTALLLVLVVATVVGCLAFHDRTRRPTRAVLTGTARSLGRLQRWVRRSPDGLLARAGLVAAVAIGLYLVVGAVVGFLVVLVVAAALGTDWHRPVAKDHWYSEERLVDAMLAAGVLRGPVRPRLGRHGAPQTDEHGASVVVVLPPGLTCSAVQARHEALASGLGVPAEHLTVTHPDGTAPNVVRLRVGTTPPRQSRTSGAAGAAGATWGGPIPLGEDEHGRPVHFAVENVHSLVAGASGSAKTQAVARPVALTAALDPTTRIYLVDGKGDGLDWAALEPCCEQYLGQVATVEDVAGLVAMLEAVLADADAIRRTAACTGKRPAPTVLLVAEEFAVARMTAKALDAKLAKRLEELWVRVLAGSRSAGVHCLLISQRGTDSYLPNDVQANVAQRIVGQFAKPSEFAWALGSDVAGRRPAAAGEFVVTTGGATRFLLADVLTDEAWTAGCQAAADTRGGQGQPGAPVQPQEPATAPVEAEIDLLADEARRVLLDAPPSGLPATALLGRLPAYVAPATVEALGRELRKRPAFAFTRGRDGRRWSVASTGTEPTPKRRPSGTDASVTAPTPS